MKKTFIYDVKLVVQVTTTGALDFITKSYEASITIGEHDYFIPFTVNYDSVKDGMIQALHEYAEKKGLEYKDLYVVSTEVYTNDDMVDISFRDNESDNIYLRDPVIEAEFEPDTYKPMVPQFFKGEDKLDHILWTWENVKDCAFRIYDHNDVIVAELGVGVLSFIETPVARGENYTRKIVAFNVDGESDDSTYKTVSLSKEEYDETLVAENRFGYIDVKPIEPVDTNVEHLGAFKSGIGDNHDLYTQTNTHDVHEVFDFDIVIEGEITEKQEHYTKIETEYKVIAEGIKEIDGPVDTLVDVNIKPWPISTVEYELDSHITDDCNLSYELGIDVSYQKERPTIGGGGLTPGTGGSGGGDIGGGGSGGGGDLGTPGNPDGKPTWPGGNWVGGIGTDEDHDFEFDFGDGNIFGPGDIIWDQIGGVGDIIINPDGSFTGNLPGNVVIEGTLPNGDKVIIEGEVLPPVVTVPDGSNPGNDETGNPLPPVIAPPPGSDGDGGGSGGGIIPTPEQEEELPHPPVYPPTTPGLPPDYVGGGGSCPCIYLYESTTVPLKLSSGGRLMNHNLLELDHHKEPPIFDHSTTPPTYIEGCLDCLETDDMSSVTVVPEILIDEETGEVIIDSTTGEPKIRYNLQGNHVGRSHFRAYYKGKTIHFNVHVVKLTLFIEPELHSMRVGNTVQYKLYKSSYYDGRDPVFVSNNEVTWEADNNCTIKSNGIATAEHDGQYVIKGTYKNKTAEAHGAILPPMIIVDYSTSSTDEYGTDLYVVKIGKRIKAKVYVNNQLINNEELHFSIDDTSKATISYSGYIEGHELGDVTLSIRYKGYEVKAPIKVIYRVVKIYPFNEAPPYDFEVFSGDSRKVTIIDEGNTVYPDLITFRTSDTNIATVDKNGQVQGRKPGSVVIEVIYDSYKYEVDALVKESTLRIEPSEIQVKTDEDFIYKVYRNDIEVKNVESTISSDTDIATVIGRIVHGQKEGTSILTVSYSGMTATALINVSLNPNNGYYIRLVQQTTYIKEGSPFFQCSLHKSGVSAAISHGVFSWYLEDDSTSRIENMTNSFADLYQRSSDLYYTDANGDKIVKLDKDKHYDEDVIVCLDYISDVYGGVKLARTGLYPTESLFGYCSTQSSMIGFPAHGHETTIYTSDCYNEGHPTETIVYTTLHSSQDKPRVALSSYEIEVFGESLVEIEEVNDYSLKIKAKLSGTAYVKLKRRDNVFWVFKIIVKDQLKIVVPEEKLDLMSYYKIPLLVNDVEVSHEDYEINTHLWHRREDGFVTPMARLRNITYIYRGQAVTCDTTTNKPTLKIELSDCEKLPDLYKSDGTLFPDAFKIKPNATVSYEFYINDVNVKDYDDCEIYIVNNKDLYRGFNNNSTVYDEANKVFLQKNTKYPVTAFTATCHDMSVNLYVQNGEFTVETNVGSNKIHLGNVITCNLISETGTIAAIAGYHSNERVLYCQYYSTNVDNSIVCGSAFAEHTETYYLQAIQGGMSNKIHVLWTDNMTAMEVNSWDTIVDSMISYNGSYDKRPFVFDGDEVLYVEPLPSNALISRKFDSRPIAENCMVYNSHVDAFFTGDSIPHSLFPVYVAYVGTTKINYVVVCPKNLSDTMKFKGRYVKELTGLNAEPEDIILDDCTYRVGGIDLTVSLNLNRYMEYNGIEYVEVGGCSNWGHGIRPTTISDFNGWCTTLAVKGEKLNYNFRTDIYRSPVTYKYGVTGSTGQHFHNTQTVITCPTKTSTSPISVDDGDLIDLVVNKIGPFLIKPKNEQPLTVYPTTYAHGIESGEKHPLSVKFNPFALINSIVKPEYTYKYGEVDPLEIRSYGIIQPDGSILFVSKGPNHIATNYRGILVGSNILVLENKKPPLAVSTPGSIYLYSSITLDVKIDGYDKVNDIPSFRYCTMTSSNENVLTVSKFNVLTGVGIGKATLTVRFLDSVEELEIEVVKLKEESIKPIGTIFGPMQTITINLIDTLGSPINPGYDYVWSVIKKPSNQFNLTPNGQSATFMAGSYGYYEIELMYKRTVSTGYTTVTRTCVITIDNISSMNTNEQMLYSICDDEMSFNIETLPDINGVDKAYTKPIVPGYFLKQKSITYFKTELITESINNREELDVIEYACSDSEIALSPPGTVIIDSVRLIRCNLKHAQFDIGTDKVFLSLSISNYLYSCYKKGVVGINIKDGRQKPLFNTSSLVYVNPVGEIYHGGKMPTTNLKYVYTQGEVTITDSRGNEFPSVIENRRPELILSLNEPVAYNEQITLTDNNVNPSYIVKSLFTPTLAEKSYVFEVNISNAKNKSTATFGDTMLNYGSKNIIETVANDELLLKLQGIPTILDVPYYEESQSYNVTVNGKRPLRYNKAGYKPFVTIAPAFDLMASRVKEVDFKVVIINDEGKNVIASFENEYTTGTTKVNGDILTLKSNFLETVDVVSKVTCSVIRSNLFELKSQDTILFTNNVYNPFFDSRWVGKEINNTKVSAVSKNPNVIVYPTVEDIDFKGEYNGQFAIPWNFEAYILSPSQSRWSPLIHPGYYYINNDEYFLYKDSKPKDGLSLKQDYAKKNLFVSISGTTERLDEVMVFDNTFVFPNGILDNTIINRGTIILDPTADTGTYETNEYLFATPVQDVEVKVKGDLYTTSFQISIKTDGVWQEYADYKNNRSVVSETPIEGVKLKCILVRVGGDTTPVITAITCKGAFDKWVDDNTIATTVFCTVKADTETHEVTTKTVEEILLNQLAQRGLTGRRIKTVEGDTTSDEVLIECLKDKPVLARAILEEMIDGLSNYVAFDEEGYATLSPIPRLGRPVSVRNGETYLKHLTTFDEDGNLTHLQTDSIIFDGVLAMPLKYHDVDSLEVKLGDTVLPIKTVINNMVYIEPTVKIEFGDELVATYYVKNSFFVDYNHSAEKDQCRMSVYLTSEDTDLSSIEVFYETNDESDYYAKEVETNPLYNPLNSGFIYIADKPNIPGSIRINTATTEFKEDDREYHYIYAEVLDEIGNPVPNVPVNASTLQGSITLQSEQTNKLGVVAIKYQPPGDYVGEDVVTVFCEHHNVKSDITFDIRERQATIFLVAKPSNGEFVVRDGYEVEIDIELMEDGLIPVQAETVRLMIQHRPETTLTATTDSLGRCTANIKPIVNIGLDISRIEISCKDIKQNLDLKVVI